MKYFFNFMPSREVPGPIYRVKRWFMRVQRSNIRKIIKNQKFHFLKSVQGVENGISSPPKPPPGQEHEKNTKKSRKKSEKIGKNQKNHEKNKKI